MIVCPRCGMQSPPGTVKCPACGHIFGEPFSGAGPAKPRNVGMIVALCLLGVFLLCCGGGAAVMFPVFARARQLARQTVDRAHVRAITVAEAMYAQDHGGIAPTIATSAQGEQLLGTYLDNGKKRYWHIPATYVWNPDVAGKKMESLKTVWLVHTGLNNGKFVVGFGDRTTKTETPGELASGSSGADSSGTADTTISVDTGT